MNPLDECLELKKTAGVGDLLRGFGKGLSGAAKPAMEAMKPGMAGPLVRGAVHADQFAALSRGHSLGEKAQVPLALAAGGAALAGTVYAIRKIHGAMTKQRDFKQMMQYYPQLTEAQAQRPEMFNQAYSSLRKMNPGFAADPIVAGQYMNRMLVLDPNNIGGILADAAGMKGPQGMKMSLKAGPFELG
jgi:hypothetical protein